MALQIGKMVTGVHIPIDIPGASELMNMLEGYGDLVSNHDELSLYKDLVGPSAHAKDASQTLTQADLVKAIETNMTSCGEEIKSKTNEFIKDGHAEAKILLDKSEPKWNDEKEKYDLKRYTKEADVLWLCGAHAKNIRGVQKF